MNQLLLQRYMIQGFLFKILLAPFSLLYGIGIGMRDLFYRKGLLKGISFDIPVISVGNLSVGGAGKTPHIEYLIRLLREYIDVATLSRGYKRKTKGYLIVNTKHNAEAVGDEPLQFKRKFPDVLVTVAENRTFAIPEIMKANPNTQVVLLDDAFQHRSIDPGLNVLLTEYSHPFTKDFLLPSGRLREWRSAYRRADIIVVSKCPPQITEGDRQRFMAEIQPYPNQQIFFSYYQYFQPYYMFNPRYRLQLDAQVDVLLICAIARADYLIDHLNAQVGSVQVLEYEDHRYFTPYDLGKLKKVFDNMNSQRKVILTTEKDAMRLELHRQFLIDNKMPIFAIPVRVAFHFDDGKVFDDSVKRFLLNFRE
ncbi:MAG: tetraacyldisaccharide 4'-kinase [Bacteroidota bacterium]